MGVFYRETCVKEVKTVANPQKTNGYTAIANEIIEAVTKVQFNSTQIRIILVVWRYTYGFNRKQHEISETFIVKATNISKRYISSELNKLIDMKVITLIRPSTYTKPKVIAFNKNYEEWKTNRTTVQQVNNTSTVEQPFNTTVEQSFHSTVEQLFHQERKIKDNIKKGDYEVFFEKIWALYPRKKGKGSVKATQIKKLYEIGEEKIIKCIEKYKAEIKRTNMQETYIQYGSTFFNSGYVDYLEKEINTKTQQTQQPFIPNFIETEF
jgi:phage replication O-like protein O